ncbi:MAG: acyl-CoA dehydrogenase family protein [Proteobacteria bacterium]|nr:acyl-CoA dehydrogenase family protein [Pseudomonadota bacterium]
MANFYEDNADLRFYVEKGIDWGPLYEHTQMLGDVYESLDEAKETWADTLNLIGEFSANEIAPYAAELDTQHNVLKDGDVVFGDRITTIFDQLKDLGVHGLCMPEQLGGMNAPLITYFLSAELMARGDVSVMTHHGFHGGMALAMLMFSVDEGTTTVDLENKQLVSTRFEAEAMDIVSGEAWGCMDITEPDAGSDMAALRAVGELDEDGNWTVSGTKMFITSGNGRYHFVIARTEPETQGDPETGLKGLSFFLVETYNLDEDGNKNWLATLDKVEDKLGHHASPTVMLTFEKTPAKLIGERGDGFRLMLLLMNNARIGVGFESLGLIENAIDLSKQYAAERPSMGKTIDKHEMIADYIDEMEVDACAIRAMGVRAAYYEELAQRLKLQAQFLAEDGSEEEARLLKESNKLKWKARKVTPLLKYYSSEKAVEYGQRCVQIHGGVGYTTEYGAEKLLRDAMVLPIYEGTSQIQSLMAMKDNLLWIMGNSKTFAKQLAEAGFKSRFDRDGLTRDVYKIKLLAMRAQVHLMRWILSEKLGNKPVSAWGSALGDFDPKVDFSPAMLHAEHLAKLLTDAAIASELFRQAKKWPERRELCVAFVERALPRSRYQLDLIKTTGHRILAQLHGEEAAAAPDREVA